MKVKIFRFLGRALLGFGLLLSIPFVAELINSGASLRETCWREVSKIKKTGKNFQLDTKGLIPLDEPSSQKTAPLPPDAFWANDLLVPDKTVVEKLDGEINHGGPVFLVYTVWVCLSMALLGWVVLKFHDNHRLKALPLIVGVAPVAASILSALVFYLSFSRPLLIFKEFYSYNSRLRGEVEVLFAGLFTGAVLAVVTWSAQAFFTDPSSSKELQ